MSDREDGYVEEEIYIIPYNYKDNGKLFGLIDKRALILSLMWLLPMSALNFWILPITMTYKVYLFIIVILPPTIIMCVGIGHDSFENFVKYIIKYYRNSKVYYYDK